MKRVIIWSLGVLTAFLGQIGIARGAETNVFQWTARPRLTPPQQRLLQLRSSVATRREDSPRRASEKAEITALEKQLGALAVRRAEPYELISSAGGSSNICKIFNPTGEGLVLTVSVVGDTEQVGTKRASMGRETYLPPGSTVIVSNLYWTTPATKLAK